MNPIALGLALILTGLILAALGLVNTYYNKVVFRTYEEFDAVITKLKVVQGKRWNPYRSFVIHAEYTVYGILVKGAYYTILPEAVVKVNVGDTVTVQVNPKNKEVFRIQDIEDTQEMELTRRRSPVLAAVGAVILIVGFIIMFTA